MKYWNEITKTFYDNEKDCLKAELEAKEKQNQEKIRRERIEREAKEKQEKLAATRKARAAEVEDARKAMTVAQSKYREVLETFIKDYGSYHISLKDKDAENFIFPSLFDFFNQFFK